MGDARREWVIRITCEIHNRFTRELRKAVDGTPVLYQDLQHGRIVQLREPRRKTPFPFLRSPSLEGNPGEVVHILVRAGEEHEILHRLITAAGLITPGRGTIYSERVEMIRGGAERDETLPDVDASGRQVPEGMLSRLTGICCIVPSGLGNGIAQTALELGTCVPVVTLGVGTGLRDKIGLLRVTIPAQKELVDLVVPEHDAEGIMSLIIEELRLDQPGRGFVYAYPIESAVLNTRLRIGRQSHAATIEQIIAAIDGVRGGTDWRHRFSGDDPSSIAAGRGYLRDLLCLTVVCGEECSERLVRSAMAAGAGGATGSRVRSTGGAITSPGSSPARERTTMIVRRQLAGRIVDALLAAGLTDERTAGHLEISSCPFAYTYSGSRRLMK